MTSLATKTIYFYTTSWSVHNNLRWCWNNILSHAETLDVSKDNLRRYMLRRSRV